MLFPDMLYFCHLSSFFCVFSPPLGLLGHGATQCFGCFAELHEGRLDGRKVSGNLIHCPLARTDSVWSGEWLQVLHGVRGSASKPDAQLCRGEDGQGEAESLWQQLVLPHPSFHGAHSEDAGGAGLY